MTPRADDRALRILQGHKALNHGIRRARIEPPAPAIDGSTGAPYLRRVAVRAEIVDRDVAEWPVVAIRASLRRLVDVYLTGVRFCSLGERAPVTVCIDGLHARARVKLPRSEEHTSELQSPYVIS